MNRPFLTIAVPTYNRAGFLTSCLAQLLPQVAALDGRVELLVSDNGSTDDTQRIIEDHLAAGAPIRYIRNAENIGADCNFVQCLELAGGTYFLLLGDDDLVLDGALARLLPILEREQPGVAHLKGYPFKQDFRSEVPRRRPSGEVLRFEDKAEFAAKVNIMLTFISGNVINKSRLGPDFCPKNFLDTFLVQLSWTLEALLHSEVNVFIDTFMIAAKADNTGGYELCQVFGVNMNRIFERFLARGADPRVFEAINRETITSFFPEWILRIRKKQGRFGKENPVETLRPAFRQFPTFWIMAMPAANWPIPLAKVWVKICRKCLKIIGKW